MNYHIAEDGEQVRDIFMTSEFERIRSLANNPRFIKLYSTYKDADIKSLTTEFNTLYQMMEEGKISNKKAKKAELQMICCCLAIEDALRTMILSHAELKEYDDIDVFDEDEDIKQK